MGWYEYDNDRGEFLVYFDGTHNIGGVTRDPQLCNGRMKYIWALARLELGGEADTIEEAKSAILTARKFVS